MKKLWKSLIAAALAIAMCVPGCAAQVPEAPADPQTTPQTTPLPFTDVAEDHWSYDTIRFCWENNLFKGKTETAFDPAGKLSLAEAVTLAARLYSLTNGGDGTFAAVPDFEQPYVRFLAEDGTEIASFTRSSENQPWSGNMGGPYIGLSRLEDDPALPETCTMVIGLEGYPPVKSFPGTRHTYFAKDDLSGGLARFHGFYGTGYLFEDSNGASEFRRWKSLLLVNDSIDEFKDQWWFSASFYLASHTDFNLYNMVYHLYDGNNAQANVYEYNAGLVRDAATRSVFAYLIDLVLDDELEVINDTAVPDVDSQHVNADAILRLYRSGILAGVDSTGRFNGGGTLTREQAATVLARVLKPELRKTV